MRRIFAICDPVAQLETLFNVSLRSKDNHMAAGFGLPTAQSIVLGHGGELSVQSEVEAERSRQERRSRSVCRSVEGTRYFLEGQGGRAELVQAVQPAQPAFDTPSPPEDFPSHCQAVHGWKVQPQSPDAGVPSPCYLTVGPWV